MKKNSIKFLILITALFTLLYTNVICEAACSPKEVIVEDTQNGTITAPSISCGSIDITVTPDEGYVLNSLSVKKAPFPKPTMEKTNYFEKINVSKK